MRQNAEAWIDDPVLAPLMAAAAANPEVEGVILSGSRLSIAGHLTTIA
jgi:hypothetical protein